MANNQIVMVSGEPFTTENVTKLLLVLDVMSDALVQLRRDNDELKKIIAEMGAC